MECYAIYILTKKAGAGAAAAAAGIILMNSFRYRRSEAVSQVSCCLSVAQLSSVNNIICERDEMRFFQTQDRDAAADDQKE